MATTQHPSERINGRYELVETLGRGSFGETLLARDHVEDRPVAIKTLHPERADDLKAFEMFEREATVLKNLRHHGVPAVLDSFHARWQGAETAFLIMEYVEGPTLEQLIKEGHLFGTEDILALFVDLAGVLEYLHGRAPPILHRDIKPSNVILRSQSPVLVDFGAVRNVFRAPDESGSTVVGTFGYMPYEQYMGQATPSSDLYALGATMLHVVTGRPPSEFLSDHGRLEVPAAIPGGDRMREVLVRLLAPSPPNRFQSAHALRRALLGVDAPEHSGPVPALRSTSSPTRHRAETFVEQVPAAPRELAGETLKAFQNNVVSTWALMGSMRRSSTSPTPGAVAHFMIMSLVSVGILPVVFWLMSTAHRRRLKPFFLDGEPGLASIQTISIGGTAFGDRMARVTYEFEADGEIHRGTDHVLTTAADRWREGDVVPVLYLRDRHYDSVIVNPV